MRCLTAALIIAAAALAGCNRDTTEEGLDAAIPAGPPVPYSVSFSEGLPPELSGLLPEVSKAKAGEEDPPTSEIIIRRRAEDDVPLLQSALQSQGYYAGEVTTTVERPPTPPGGEPAPVAVEYTVTPGPRFIFANVTIDSPGAGPGWTAPTAEELGLRRGEPALAQTVLDAEAELLRRARKAGFALAELGQRSTVIDPERSTMDVGLVITPQRQASFGPVAFTGADDVSIGFLRNRLPFEEGQRFDPDLLEEGRRNLYDTNLFATVVVRQPSMLTTDDQLPLTLELTPRARRSFGVGLGFESDIGPNASTFWEHRNLLGSGERFRTELELSLPRQELTASLNKPDFLRRDQSLIGNASALIEDTDAYYTKSISAGVGIERMLTPRLTVGAGVNYRFVELEEQDEEPIQYGLLSLPLKLDWDFSNDMLNPTAGGRLLLNTAPYIDTLGLNRRFLKSRITTTRYLQLLASPQLVLAGRASLGSIIGASREDIPADERFYAGGGGSVRGVGYQLAGELDDDDDPLGGRSLIEVGAELRYRITESIGAVLFLDGGAAQPSPFPTFEEELRWGAGPGLRYFTPIGPLRVDLGFPLQPRDGVDDLFQLYLSIGQAF